MQETDELSVDEIGGIWNQKKVWVQTKHKWESTSKETIPELAENPTLIWGIGWHGGEWVSW